MYDLTSEEEAKEYLQNVQIEYQFQCYHEKDSSGCYRLAEFLLNVRKEYEKSSDLFKMTCDDYKHGHACFRFGNNKILGKGCKKDMSDALNYHIKGCDYGHWNSCHNAGLLNKKNKNSDAAISFFTKACDNNDLESCYHLSAAYIKGTGVEKNMNTAFKYAKKACDLGNMYACANVSQMYRKGDGVEIDPKKADEYKKQAEKMYKHVKKIRESESVKFNR